MLRVRLLQTDAQIRNLIYNSLAIDLDKHLKDASPKLLDTVRRETITSLRKCPEILALSSGGALKADFGLTQDPTGPIISSIINTVSIRFRRVRNVSGRFEGGFTITMQPDDYSNLLTLPIANQAIDGGSLPWLKWLLTFGDTIIIANYGVEYGPFGRTGLARMKEKIGPFKVRSQYSGTIDDNFITRALATDQSRIEQALVRVLS